MYFTSQYKIGEKMLINRNTAIIYILVDWGYFGLDGIKEVNFFVTKIMRIRDSN